MKRTFAAFLLALAASFLAAPGHAQDSGATPLSQILSEDIPAERLALAAKLVDLTGTARLFDQLLPNIADQAKNSFIRANPQMQLGIISVVDKIAVQLVSRRPELDNYLARVWASGFTDEELQGLVDFYSSDLGSKYAVALPQLLAVQTAAAEEWAKSVNVELTQKVQEELRAAMAAETQALQNDVAGPAQAPQQ
jgi:hypothetical protein